MNHSDGNLQDLIDAFTPPPPPPGLNTPTRSPKPTGIVGRVQEMMHSPSKEGTTITGKEGLRPTRQRSQTRLYQSEVEEEREKQQKENQGRTSHPVSSSHSK